MSIRYDFWPSESRKTNNTQDKLPIQQLLRYLQSQSKRSDTLSQLTALLQASDAFQVGIILTERLINIPSEVVPPMYMMLMEEITWALEEKEPYNFTHYLIFSKTYQEIVSALDEEDSPRPKKQKNGSKKGSSQAFYFHPEDEVLEKHAVTYGSFPYHHESGGSDSKRAFQELGIKPAGHLILLEAAKLEAAVKGLSEYFNQT